MGTRSWRSSSSLALSLVFIAAERSYNERQYSGLLASLPYSEDNVGRFDGSIVRGKRGHDRFAIRAVTRRILSPLKHLDSTRHSPARARFLGRLTQAGHKH